MGIDYEAEIAKRDQQIAELLQRTQEMEQEIKRLKELLQAKGGRKGAKRPKFKLNYSVEGSSRAHRRGQQATGRYRQAEKLEQVSVREVIYPDGVDSVECEVQRHQYVWRILNGQAEYVEYTLYGIANAAVPEVPGVRTRRSEYGIEIILMVAYLHYWIGLSLDHVCEVLQFFTGLALSKSQANALLNQLSHDWGEQYETIAALLAEQMVIYIDETGWQVGAVPCYTWAFSTLMYVLFRCGVGRGKAEAQAIVGEQFGGIGVSDDYAAYQSLFATHQLCWAHLLRKAIKLRLEHPDEASYGEFLEQLCQIYQQAVRTQKDRRLSVGRRQKAQQLQARIVALCTRAGEALDPETMTRHEMAFIRLQNELVKGLAALFVFVEHPEVEPTNNRSERNVRREAEIRKGGRTSKTEAGAERRSIVMTVLATLQTRFEKFRLSDLVAEVQRWFEQGCSIFQLEWAQIEQANPPP